MQDPGGCSIIILIFNKRFHPEVESFYMKIIMRRDSVMFRVEHNRIDNAVKAVSFNLKRVSDMMSPVLTDRGLLAARAENWIDKTFSSC